MFLKKSADEKWKECIHLLNFTFICNWNLSSPSVLSPCVHYIAENAAEVVAVWAAWGSAGPWASLVLSVDGLVSPNK